MKRRAGGRCFGPMRLIAPLYGDIAQMGLPFLMRLVGFAGLWRDDLKIQDRGVLRVVEYFLMGYAQLGGCGQGFACPGVAVKARVGAAGHL